MVIHRLTNQTVGSGTYLQESTYGGNVEGNHEGTKCWRKSWAVQRGSQGKAWAVLDLRSLNGHLRILFICPEISDGFKLNEKHLHTYPKDWDVERKTNISATFPQRRGLSQTCCFFHSTNGTKGTENDKPHAEMREMVLANVIVNNITRMEHQSFTHGSCRDGRCGALCWLTMRWQHDGVQMGGIRTAHWCFDNPRLACSRHLYLHRSHCQKRILPSCCHTVAGMMVFW